MEDYQCRTNTSNVLNAKEQDKLTMRLPFWVKKTDTGQTGEEAIVERATSRNTGEELQEEINLGKEAELGEVYEKADKVPTKRISSFTKNKAELWADANRRAIEIHETNVPKGKKVTDLYGLRTVKVLMRPVDERFEDMRASIQDVVKGVVLSLLIYGTAGIGKTHSVKKALTEAGYEEGKDWVILTSDCTPAGLYETALKFRQKDKIIVLDDIDFQAGANGKAMWELVKAMTDTYETRTVARTNKNYKLVSSAEEAEKYLVECEKKKEKKGIDKLPSMFGYQGRLVVITNLTESFFDEAYLSRSVTCPLFLTEDEKIEHMRYILREMNPDMDYFLKERVLNALHDQHIEDRELNKLAGTEHLNRTQFDLRTLEKALKIAKSDPDWKRRLHHL